jgi:hypothetical protein
MLKGFEKLMTKEQYVVLTHDVNDPILLWEQVFFNLQYSPKRNYEFKGDKMRALVDLNQHTFCVLPSQASNQPSIRRPSGSECT